MRGLIRWAVGHPTIVNLIMAGISVAGLFAIDLIPKDVFPETALDMVVVSVVYRGAGPREIEKGLLIKIEEAVQTIEGIEQISAEARENQGMLRLELARGTNVARVVREVKDQLEQISSFPQDAERPLAFELVRRFPVINLALHGNLPRAALQKLADRIKDDMLRLSLVNQVTLRGLKQREISVEINESKLRRYGLQIADVGNALRRANLDLSGGQLKTKREDLILRAYGKRYTARELERIPVRALPGSNPIRILDIARVHETFEDRADEFMFNGQPAVQLGIERSSGDNALKIANQLYAYLKQVPKRLPQGVKLSMYNDLTVQLRSRIELLSINGIQGLILVLIVLVMLMNLRLAFWVAAGLPISILGAFVLIHTAGVTINMISMFGMILVIGILVDDAIVVGENVYAHLEAGKTPMQAAIDGTIEVMPAVFAAVSTTILAFVPLFFMGGLIGKFIYVIPVVVISCLLLSLFESLLILPPHLAHSLKPIESVQETQSRIRNALEDVFKWINFNFYARILRFFLHQRWPALGIALASFFIAIGLVRGGVIKFVFFPELDAERIISRFVMEPGTPLQRTQQAAGTIERAAREVDQHFYKKFNQHVVQLYVQRIGSQQNMSPGFSPPSGEEVGEVQLQLLEGEQRKVHSRDIIALWRKKVGKLAGAQQMSFESFGGPPVGRALEIQLLSNDLSQLRTAVDFLKKRLATYPGVSDPEDDLSPGKREIRFRLKPLAHSMGVTLQQIATQIRDRVYGQEVMRLQRGRDEVRIFVRYPDTDRASIQQLHRLWIRTPTGQEFPLTSLATWSYTRSLQIIRRINRQQMANVFANLDDTKGNRADIVRDLQRYDIPKLNQLAPEVSVIFAGQGREQAKVFGGLRIAFPIALFGIFAILVAVFQSYLQAFLIMAVIPFGLIGAMLGHLMMGVPLTILSFFGIVGLSGVVVNDSLVMVDALNRHMAMGKPVFQATWETGQSRLRAILSTTLTTAVGLGPIMLEKSRQAQFLIPMAISLAFGVLFATAITLVLVPCLFLIINDVRRFLYWLRRGVWPSREEVEPEAIRFKQQQDPHAHH